MIGWRERCTLAPMSHVVLAKVIDDNSRKVIRHVLAVAQLPCLTCLRLVPYGLSVKSNHIDRGQIDAGSLAKFADGLTLQIRYVLFDAEEICIGERKSQ